MTSYHHTILAALKENGITAEEARERTQPKEYHPLQLGDAAEAMLSSVGITKELVAAIKKKVGLPPTCNCEDRKEWLNRVGQQFGSTVTAALSKLWG
jgi:hypothetical protein